MESQWLFQPFCHKDYDFGNQEYVTVQLPNKKKELQGY
jgi:hypothetical protein